MLRYTVVLLLAAGLMVYALPGSADQPNKVGGFMRLKLTRSQELLEGIALEDFAKIAKNAEAISLLCEDELWQVFQTPEYLAHSEQFRRTANSIIKAADDENLDGAALGYVALTLQCVDCHKYVRDVRMAKLQPKAAVRSFATSATPK